MKEYYYFYRDSVNAPIITVCLIKDKDNVARGISICSIEDNPQKKIGRKWARHYAKKALGTKESGNPVNKVMTRGVLLIAKDPKGNYVSRSVDSHILEMKSVFNPKLTKFECSLLKI